MKRGRVPARALLYAACALVAAAVTAGGGGTAVVVASASARHLAGPPLAHTGGFGEPTCQECHFDAPLNAPGGQLRVAGLPEGYEPGLEYELVVALERAGMQRAGFQLAIRFADGAQAGELIAADQRVAVAAGEGGVHYAQHTERGAAPGEPGRTRWRLLWLAPAAGTRGEEVFLHVAANAANYDDSEFGDFVYLLERSVPLSR